MTVDLDSYTSEVECLYDDERYSVRDNGAVLRHPPEGKRARPTDLNWTFGKPNIKTGYMEIAAVRVHRIVATAFHGIPPEPTHVVDHIDTNRRNNRPDNLRWITRLENAILNPITRQRILFACGSIEAFLADPSILRHSTLDRNFEWMRAVTPEEAKACRERLLGWAESGKLPAGASLGEWVYKPIVNNLTHPVPEPLETQHAFSQPETQPRPLLVTPVTVSSLAGLTVSLTPGSLQRNWRTPSKFLLCPDFADPEPLTSYAAKIFPEAIFATNQYGDSIALEHALSVTLDSLWVVCASTGNSIKPYALAKVTLEDGHIVHTNLGSFFTKEGAMKRFTLAQGLDWDGSDSIDDCT